MHVIVNVRIILKFVLKCYKIVWSNVILCYVYKNHFIIFSVKIHENELSFTTVFFPALFLQIVVNILLK